MEKYYLKKLTKSQLKSLCKRKAIRFDDVFPIVRKIIKEVREKGDEAVRDYTEKFDGVRLNSFEVTQEEISSALKRMPKNVQLAFKKAAQNIEKFQKI